MNHPNPGQALNYQLLRLGALLQLEQRARAASRNELEFLIVNETAGIVAYQQAALWQNPATGTAPLVLSGVAAPDEGGPYYRWLDRVVAAIARGEHARESHLVSAADLPEALAREWPEWFPAQALWCPLTWRDGVLVGSLLLGRTDPWNDGERQLLDALAGTYAQSLLLHQRIRETGFWRRLPTKRGPLGIAAALLLLVALLPVRESVLAPAEIAPIDPAPVRAPFDGVVGALQVAPNQPVHAGQALVSLERTQLQIEVPEASVVSFEPGSEVVFFSNLSPDQPLYGRLVFASYASTATADGVMSYAFRAALDPGVTPRLGLKGTAKIYGPRKALVLWLLRRPIAVVREWLSI